MEVVELPKTFAFEEVSFTIFPLEHAVDVVAYAFPHRHVARVIVVNATFFFVIFPVHRAAVEISIAVVTPNHGSV